MRLTILNKVILIIFVFSLMPLGASPAFALNTESLSPAPQPAARHQLAVQPASAALNGVNSCASWSLLPWVSLLLFSISTPLAIYFYRAYANLREDKDKNDPAAKTATDYKNLLLHQDLIKEQERSRIARDIHDEFGSLLVAINMNVGWIKKQLTAQPAIVGKCEEIQKLIDTAVVNVDRIVCDLRPSILDYQGIWSALEWYVQEIVQRANLGHEIHIEIEDGISEPGANQSTAIFRIFQEMLSNVVRHAEAKQIYVHICAKSEPDANLFIEVRDDGIGNHLSKFEHATSYGIMGMRERAKFYNGSVKLDSAPDQGTRVTLTMPLMHHEENQ